MASDHVAHHLSIPRTCIVHILGNLSPKPDFRSDSISFNPKMNSQNIGNRSLYRDSKTSYKEVTHSSLISKLPAAALALTIHIRHKRQNTHFFKSLQRVSDPTTTIVEHERIVLADSCTTPKVADQAKPVRSESSRTSIWLTEQQPLRPKLPLNANPTAPFHHKEKRRK